MRYYRLYFMNHDSGHIEDFLDLECSSDAEAIDFAGSHQGYLALELWNEHRKVVRIEAQDLASQLLARRRRKVGSGPSEHTKAALAS